MSKHTQGPWYADKIQDRNAYNIFQHGGTSAIVTISGTDSSVEANARLIADAPDLLEALRAAKELCDKALPKFNWGASALDAEAIRLLNEVPNKIAAAIAKAEASAT